MYQRSISFQHIWNILDFKTGLGPIWLRKAEENINFYWEEFQKNNIDLALNLTFRHWSEKKFWHNDLNLIKVNINKDQSCLYIHLGYQGYPWEKLRDGHHWDLQVRKKFQVYFCPKIFTNLVNYYKIWALFAFSDRITLILRLSLKEKIF